MVIVKLPAVLVFEWDTGNEQKNWLKHQVTSEEAEEPFFSDDYIILEDKPHSHTQEQRYILLGKTHQEKLLFLVFTICADKVRIISARKAKKKEVIFYEKAIAFTNVSE
jgi:uncharacterized DUF497 family protein